MKLDDKKRIDTVLACELPLVKLEETISQFASETKLISKSKVRRYCKKMQKHNYEISLIYSSDILVGFLSLRKKRGKMYVSEIAVKSEYQHRGFGTLLLKEVHKQYPHSPFFLHVRKRNLAAINCYKKLGYCITCKLPVIFYYSNPYDRVLKMVKKTTISNREQGETHEKLTTKSI